MLGGRGGHCPTMSSCCESCVGGMWAVEVVVVVGGGDTEGPNKLQVLSLFKMGKKRFSPPFCFADLDTFLLSGLKQDLAQSSDVL